MSLMIKFINPLSPNPQNGQTHSNNSSGNETSGLPRSIIRKPVNQFNLNIDWLVSLWLTLILHNDIHYSVKKQILTLIFIFVYTIYINHICLPQFIDLSIYNSHQDSCKRIRICFFFIADEVTLKCSRFISLDNK